MSSPPNSPSTAAKSARASSTRLISATVPKILPRGCISATARSTDAWVRPQMATAAPSCSRRSAMARPMPRVPPVTMAYLPLSESMTAFYCSTGQIVCGIYSRPIIVPHPWSDQTQRATQRVPPVATSASLPTFFEACRYEYRHGSLKGYATLQLGEVGERPPAGAFGADFGDHNPVAFVKKVLQDILQLRRGVGTVQRPLIGQHRAGFESAQARAQRGVVAVL